MPKSSTDWESFLRNERIHHTARWLAEIPQWQRDAIETYVAWCQSDVIGPNGSAQYAERCFIALMNCRWPGAQEQLITWPN